MTCGCRSPECRRVTTRRCCVAIRRADGTLVPAPRGPERFQVGDVLIAISGSGNSPNVVRAAEVAREKGMHVIGLTGKNGGRLADLGAERGDRRGHQHHIALIHPPEIQRIAYHPGERIVAVQDRLGRARGAGD